MMAGAALVPLACRELESFLGTATAGPRTTLPYLQMVDAESVVVAWFTPFPEIGEVALYDLDDPETPLAVLADDEPVEHHQIRISGFEPGRSYGYRLTGPASTSDAMHLLRTPKLPGEPIVFAVFGDTGSGLVRQSRVARQVRAVDPDYVIHTGDVVYPSGADADYDRTVFQPYRRIMDRTVFFPCLGNHDVETDDGAPYLRNFILPDNGPEGLEPGRCYSIRLGDVLLVSLDLTRDRATVADVIVPWMRAELAASDAMWKIVFSHYPVYTSGTERRPPDPAAVELWAPIFDEEGVDLYFAGHNHFYERSHPLRGGEIVAPGEGTVYVISGNGGRSLYRRLPQVDVIADGADDVYGFVSMVIDGGWIELRHIDEDGNVLDEASWEKPLP